MPMIPTQRDALLVMDVQDGIVQRVPGGEALLERLATAIAAARDAALPIIYVVVQFRPGYPEVSARNMAFTAIRRAGDVLEEAQPTTAVHTVVAPHHGDIIVAKRRVSAFSGSDLEVVLRALEVDGLILTGISTSGVVLSTLRAAADLDFRCAVLSDACADGDEEVHRVLLTKVFPHQATVLSVAEWAAALQTAER